MITMKHTVFDTPLVYTLLRWTSLFILKISGWKIVRKIPASPKYVLIAAPHTSNWDFVFTLLFAFALDIKVYSMGKQELFEWPGGSLFKWLGVIPIDRSRSNNAVSQVIQLFNENDKLVIVIPPSGTRKKVSKWKTGFYHIADGAGIPIGLGFLDFGRKTGGVGGAVAPCGDYEKDLKIIRSFYDGISGKNPYCN